MKNALLCLSLLLLVSCIPPFSVNPLVPDNEGVVEPGLEGRWVASADDQLDICAKGDRKYQVIYLNDQGRTSYEGRLVRLENDLYLDLSVKEETLEEQMHGQAFFPVTPFHFWLHVDLAGDSLKIAYVPVDELAVLVDGGQVDTPHVKTSDSILLTGQTDELQALMKELRGFPGAWTDELFERLKTN